MKNLMYIGKYAPWEHYPKALRYFEVQHPLNVIIEFFDASHPGEPEKELKEWRDAVLDNKFYDDGKHGPGSLLYTYDWNLKLLEALYMLLLDREQLYPRPEPIVETQLTEEKEKWYHFPAGLSTEELLEPYKLLKKIFKKTSLPEYRDHLRDWLSQALMNRLNAEGIEAADLIIVYESLLKLYSVAWLIYQRETAETMLKDEYRINELPVIQTEVKEEALIQPISLLKTEPSPAEKLGLTEVVNLTLRTTSSVQTIVHLGTHHRPFTYYLLVLVDDKIKVPEHEISNRIEDCCRQLVSVFVICHKLQSAKDGINEGSVFWNTTLQKGKVVYETPELVMPQLQVISNERLIRSAKQAWDRWSVQGVEFLNGAQTYYDNKNYRMTAFMLHQAVESTLTAVTKARLGYKLTIHNLLRMLKVTLLFSDELMNVFDLHTKEGKRLFEPLQLAYSEARYREAFDPNESDIKLLLEKVVVFVEKAELVYERYIYGLENGTE